MNIIVFGKGGREHALAYRFAMEEAVEKVFVYPGNPGMQKTKKVEILSHLNESNEFEFISALKELNISFGVIGPEDYMINGFADMLRANGVKILAPSKEAATLESSKIFSKKIMKKYQIPTAQSLEVFSYENAMSALTHFEESVVLKLSGLQAGKGVVVCNSIEEAKETLFKWKDILSEGLVIEEKLTGYEVSMFYLCRENEFKFIGEASDHKRIFDGDQGPNTGGMGCYSPNPILTDSQRELIEKTIVAPTLSGMMSESIPFNGILFVGIMMTKKGPYVLEYNVRFGDPETQTFLPRIKSGFLELFSKYINGQDFKNVNLTFAGPSVHVVKASKGYPEKPIVGELIKLNNGLDPLYFFAGVTSRDGQLYTSGGRVCGLTVVSSNFQYAVKSCYEHLDQVKFKDQHFRKDIAQFALKYLAGNLNENE